MSQQPKALEGIKVAIVGAVVTAPTMGRYLGMHGATVVRVDSHSRLDGLRSQRPFHSTTCSAVRTIGRSPEAWTTYLAGGRRLDSL